MSSAFGPKQIILLFLAVLALYAASYTWIEHRRHVKGPWEVTFDAEDGGRPSLSIDQPALGVTNLTLRFSKERLELTETGLPVRIRFDKPLVSVPYGRVIFEDLTFLPGVVTFDLFGHEIELMPRVLVINKQEIPWRTGAAIDLGDWQKPAESPQPPKSRGPQGAF
jgi:hypothetical protein